MRNILRQIIILEKVKDSYNKTEISQIKKGFNKELQKNINSVLVGC